MKYSIDTSAILDAWRRRYPPVTAEAATGKADSPNIPDVCSAMGVRSMTLLELFREQGWRF